MIYNKQGYQLKLKSNRYDVEGYKKGCPGFESLINAKDKTNIET